MLYFNFLHVITVTKPDSRSVKYVNQIFGGFEKEHKPRSGHLVEPHSTYMFIFYFLLFHFYLRCSHFGFFISSLYISLKRRLVCFCC